MSEIMDKEDEKDPNLNIEITAMNSTESQPTSTENPDLSVDLSVDLSEEADNPIEKSATDSAIYPSQIEDELTSSNLDEAKNDSLQDEESPELEGELDGFVSEQQLEERLRQLQSQIDAHIFEIDSTLDAIDKAERDFERIIAVQENFEDWVTERRASFAWKLMDRLHNYREDLDSDESKIKNYAEEEFKLDFGFAERTRKWFLSNFLINILISLITITILYLLHRSSPAISSYVANNVQNDSWRNFLQNIISFFIGSGFWNIILWIAALSFAHFFALLFSYSRRNSEYQKHVLKESARAKKMEEGIHKVLESRERIDSLHPQVLQVLEVLSLGLHTPWLIDEKAMSFNGSLPDSSNLPVSLELSTPVISKSDPVYEELVFKAMNEFQIPGWRSESYNRVIQKLANSIGFGQNELALRELDEDQRRSGKRQLLLTMTHKDDIYKLIGDDLVEQLAGVIQEKILTTVQPLVETLKPNPLADLELSSFVLRDEFEEQSRWEAKLSEIAGFAAPWSSETFSTAGAASKKHEYLESVFLASERVQGLAVKGIEAHSDVRPGSRPFEVSIRIDLSAWCKPNEVLIFEDYQPSADQLNRWSKNSTVGIDNATVEPEFENPKGLII
jgi:hypothetical protein